MHDSATLQDLTPLGLRRAGRGPRVAVPLCLAALLAAALAVSACGGDDAAGTSERSTTSGKPPARGDSSSPDRGAKRGARKGSRKRRASKGRSGGGPAVPPEKRKAVAEKTARIVLTIFGYRNADVSATRDGTRVAARIAASEACEGSAGESRIAARIRKAAPFVRTVEVTAGGNGQSLSGYVRSRCAPLRLPGGTGRVVLTKKGSGPTTTKTFRVRSRRWTIEYANGGSFLQVLPMKDSLPTLGVVSVTERGAGRKVQKGAGRYSLQINGMGRWAVRVRDGAR